MATPWALLLFAYSTQHYAAKNQKLPKKTKQNNLKAAPYHKHVCPPQKLLCEFSYSLNICSSRPKKTMPPYHASTKLPVHAKLGVTVANFLGSTGCILGENVTSPKNKNSKKKWTFRKTLNAAHYVHRRNVSASSSTPYAFSSSATNKNPKPVTTHYLNILPSPIPPLSLHQQQ